MIDSIKGLGGRVNRARAASFLACAMAVGACDSFVSEDGPDGDGNSSGHGPTAGSRNNGGGASSSMPHPTGGAGAAARGAGPTTNAGGDAGGAATTPPADFLWPVSGTRLQSRVIVSDDGVEFPYDIYDSKLGVACTPTKFVDGVYRCLGDSQYVWHFSDSECTQRVAVPRNAYAPGVAANAGDLVLKGVDYGCDGFDPETMFRIADEVPLPEQLYGLDGAVCSPSSWQPNATQKAYATVAFDVDDLVSLSADEVALGSRLAAPVWLGNDGSRLPGNMRVLHDLERDTDVELFDTETPYGNTNAGWRLVPSTDVSKIACTTPGCNPSDGVGGGPTSTNPFFLTNPLACGRTLEDPGYVTFLPPQGSVHTFSGALVNATIYQSGGEGNPGPMQVRGFQASAAIPLEAWQEALPVETAGRFGLGDHQAEGTVLAGVPYLLDKDLANAPCAPWRAADDELRCLPQAGAAIAYIDEDCSEPVANYWAPQGVGGSSANGPSELVVPAFAIPPLNEEPRPVYALGDPTSSPKYFVRANGECVPTTFDSNNAIREVTEIPPETFGRLSIETR